MNPRDLKDRTPSAEMMNNAEALGLKQRGPGSFQFAFLTNNYATVVIDLSASADDLKSIAKNTLFQLGQSYDQLIGALEA
jgi:hypothetical protein